MSYSNVLHNFADVLTKFIVCNLHKLNHIRIRRAEIEFLWAKRDNWVDMAVK